MNITYRIIAYRNHLRLGDFQYSNLEEVFNFIKGYGNKANEYKIITHINGTEVAKDIIFV